jgi:hypothetical protein
MYFIKIPEHGAFTRGIWIPYATKEEAERQVSNDLLSTDFIDGIYTADVVIPRVGFMDHVDGFPEHTFADKHERVMTVKQIQKVAPKHLEAMQKEREESVVNQMLSINRILEAMRTGRADELDEDDARVARRLGWEAGPNAVAGAPGFKLVTGGTATAGPVALSATTAKTVIGIAAGSVGAPTLASFGISFDGVTQANVPVLCEPVSGTNATNPPGTNSTSMTPKQIRGWSKGGPSSTGAYNWTAEPTVLEVYDKVYLTPAGGLLSVQLPLDREPAAIATAATQFKFFGIRMTAPNAVNTHTSMEIDE